MRWRRGLFGRVVLLLVSRDFLAGRLVDDLHRQADLAALVEAEELDPDLLAFLDDVLRLGNALGSELRDVDEAVTGAEEVDEGAEIGSLDDRAFIDLANF